MRLDTPNSFDTEVSWIGVIPTRFSLIKSRRKLSRNKKLNTGMQCVDRLALTLKGVIPRLLTDVNGLQASEFETYQIFEKNDLVFKLIDLQNIKTSRVGLVPCKGIMSPAYIRLTPSADCFPKFCYWYFTDLYNRQIFNRLGSGVRETLGYEDLLDVPFLYPQLQEQRQIAAYLNRETSKIDKLIAKQQKLIKLLQEKRQAVISQAVTKGLDPNVKMKDSGVEWLGEVPEHWIVYRVKNLLAILTDYTANGSFADLAANVKYLDSGYSRLVRLTDLRLALTNEEGIYVSEESHAYLKKSSLHGGELLVANVGAYAGFACMMPKVEFPCTLGPNMYLLRFKTNRTTSEFMNLIFGTLYFSEQLKLKATSTAQPKLNKENVKTCFVCLPSIEEQNGILDYINSRLKDLNNVIVKSKSSIDLLKEHRHALITAAVTGKIDVRGLVTDEEVAALDAEPEVETTEEDLTSEVLEDTYITEEE